MQEPSLSGNFVRMMYELFSHNYIVIGYFAGLIVSALAAFKKPTRTHFLIVIGFALLVFNFEYEKHISEGLRDQTVSSVVGQTGNLKAKSLVALFIEFVFPIVTFYLGIALILFGLVKEAFLGPAVETKSK